MRAIKFNRSPENKEKSVIKFNNEYLKVEYWSTLLNFNESYSYAAWKKQQTILLNNDPHPSCYLQGTPNAPVSLQNNYAYSVFNLYIYSNHAEKVIFELAELPEKKSIKLEFNKEGVYELYYSNAESSFTGKTTFSISQPQNFSVKKFHWNSESIW